MCVLPAFALPGLVPEVESDSAELEEESRIKSQEVAFLFHRRSYCIFFKAGLAFLLL